MKKVSVMALMIVALGLAWLPSSLSAHCEVPCGIFDDSTRFVMIAEDVKTIEKAMAEIATLSKAAEPNYNQIVRWVNTKDEHAQKIIDICSQYFLAQRVKAVEPADTSFAAYQTKLTLLHQMIAAAVKTKQTTDPANAAKITGLAEKFKTAYFGAHGHAH
ncbi:MAG: superoxide dismutase, Ni [candidate division Zixibacteria bacterium]|nr:superoxide dismutase, Ni [candidate division Zixibacteria bacterium]